MSEKTPPQTKLGLKPVEVGVGAGAAVVTAFASSYLGTAGTLTGAALASILGTVSTSVLRTSVERTNESLQRTTSRLRQTMRTGPEMRGSTGVDPGLAAVDPAELPTATEPLPGAPGEPAAAEGGPGDAAAAPSSGPGDAGVAPPGDPGGGGRRPRWAVLAVGTVAAFLLALVAITGIESALGKPLAALIGNETGGGTSVGRTVRVTPVEQTDEQDERAPAPTSTPTEGTSPSPSDTPSPTAETSPTESPSESASPESSPSPGPEPSATEPAPTQPAPSPVPSP